MNTPRLSRESGAMNVLAALLESRTGQQIAANRAWRIETALKPLIRRIGADGLDGLVSQILSGAHPDLADVVVDAMLNQESSFFRDAGVLEQVADALAARPGRQRIWCAGCAGGQEPLSLAMLFTERADRDGAAIFPEIFATDVSAPVLARARAGRFSQFEIQRGLPVRRMVRWFDQEGEDWVASPDLVSRIAFRRQNLVGDPAPHGGFDAILCRNVLLYLSPVLRRQVLETMAAALRPGGLLVLGAGETVIGQSESFAPSRHYRGFYEVAQPPAERFRATG